MEKIKKDFEIYYDLDWQGETSLDRIKQDVSAIEALGATHINIDHGIDFDSSYIRITVLNSRVETDEEFEKRVLEIRTKTKEIKKRDMEYFQKIKEKYNL